MTRNSNRLVLILLMLVLALQILDWVASNGRTESAPSPATPEFATRADVAHLLELIEARLPDSRPNPAPERVDVVDAAGDIAEIRALLDDFRGQLSAEFEDFMRALEALAGGAEHPAASNLRGSGHDNFHARNTNVASNNQVTIRPTPPSTLVRIPVGASFTIYDEALERLEPQPGLVLEEVGRDHEVIHILMSTGSFPARGTLVISHVSSDGRAIPKATFESVPR